ncbi:hypothetical protein [Paludisphaera mucosa]|uniref:Uncharacterized protein n=1 Tax=Paludisphaera mucosa TaxID=3030827 RepID=A0ABT6F6P9_9BACT|nr:hypothetical protein [Paludisphaera mucosa]MDG3003273.1 hypothetical protein [Paludisphaera mucosa]
MNPIREDLWCGSCRAEDQVMWDELGELHQLEVDAAAAMAVTPATDEERRRYLDEVAPLVRAVLGAA